MRFFIDTLGCKVNQYETQAMQTILMQHGHTLSVCPEDAQVRIINTCAVTGESGRKSRQAIRRAKKESPQAIIAVCGCFSQISPDEISALGADLVGGSADRTGFIEKLEQIVSDNSRIVDIDNPLKRRSFELLPSGGLSGRTRALLKIQDGCSNFCSYCIIPYARGPVRSMPLENVSSESAAIAEAGYREIVITGIEISSYGLDFRDGTSLIDAISAVSSAAPGIRIRLGSLEPRTATEEFCRRAKEIPNLCNHFHLSLQSGCDATLKRMRRKYDTSVYYDSVCNLRRYFPGCAITTDVIVGFPGETREDFEASVEFMKKCGFADAHIFPYSPRPGTPAADMDAQISKEEKHRRASEASAAAAELHDAYASSFVGKNLSVLFEQEKDGDSSGHAKNYLIVHAKAEGIHNIVRTVHITDYRNSELCGIIVQQ